jgi:hypothetical protein
MAEEIDSSVAYLKALKQSVAASPGSAAAAPAPARERVPHVPASSNAITADSGDGFKGADKRRSPRFKCEGSAELRKEDCDVRTWATFTDISMNGCYVEAQANYPVGTVLHMKLEANGVRVETQGSVRVSYPYLGMGIAFVSLTEDNKARLRALLAAIPRSTVVVGPGLASSLPASAPLPTASLVTDPGAALSALNEFFESRQMLMREDFLRIVRLSQGTSQKK